MTDALGDHAISQLAGVDVVQLPFPNLKSV